MKAYCIQSAHVYRNWEQGNAMTKHVIESVGVQNGEHILDAGCGTVALVMCYLG